MNAPRGVLFLGAHPDDETVMAGGTLAMLTARGIAVHLVCATDGRGGESGDVIEASTPEALARVRESELRGAAKALGATSLTLLGYEDPVVGPGEKLFPFAADEDALVTRIADLIRQAGADVVLSHGSDGEYGHPAHIQMHRVTIRAVREHAPNVVFYSVAAWVQGTTDRLWNVHDPAHLALDIHPWIEAKHAAMLCHRTQHALFKRRRQLQTVREAIRTVESFHRHWPPFLPDQPPDDAFAAALLAAGATRPDSFAVQGTPALTVIAGPQQGVAVWVTHSDFVIGRGSGCDLRLDDRSVSRRHAQIAHAEGGWYVQDLGSSAGTYVNGTRVQSVYLNRGDQIVVGNTTLVFDLPG